ncbi:hypothetical protein PT974_10075 [Cladobotryum mycophilum]|uniref:Uncharacterized protein n=1 Tax=Cladobotryum mycophilum TaxID=491253 RepID=A0ABR0S9X4_9HYPO
MTTGRINQVTIVSRGEPGLRRRVFQRRRDFGYWVGANEWRAAGSAAGSGASCAFGGNPLPPASLPRASVRRTEPAVGSAA